MHRIQSFPGLTTEQRSEGQARVITCSWLYRSNDGHFFTGSSLKRALRLIRVFSFTHIQLKSVMLNVNYSQLADELGMLANY